LQDAGLAEPWPCTGRIRGHMLEAELPTARASRLSRLRPAAAFVAMTPSPETPGAVGSRAVGATRKPPPLGRLTSGFIQSPANVAFAAPPPPLTLEAQPPVADMAKLYTQVAATAKMVSDAQTFASLARKVLKDSQEHAQDLVARIDAVEERPRRRKAKFDVLTPPDQYAIGRGNWVKKLFRPPYQKEQALKEELRKADEDKLKEEQKAEVQKIEAIGNEAEKLELEDMNDLAGLEPVPPWLDPGVVAQGGSSGVKLHHLKVLVRNASEHLRMALEDSVKAVEEIKDTERFTAGGGVLKGLYDRGKPLVTPEALGDLEAVRMPPPLIYRWTNAGHNPGLWCQRVCHTTTLDEFPAAERGLVKESQFAPPPWLRHARSLNRRLLDYHNTEI